MLIGQKNGCLEIKGEKRPADVIGNAITIARIAVGEDIAKRLNHVLRRKFTFIIGFGDGAGEQHLPVQRLFPITINCLFISCICGLI